MNRALQVETYESFTQDGECLVVLTDAYELRQYVRYFREIYHKKFKKVHFYVSFLAEIDRKSFARQLKYNEYILSNLINESRIARRLNELLFLRYSMSYFIKIRSVHHFSANYKIRKNKKRRLLSAFLPSLLSRFLKPNIAGFDTYDSILLMRPDSYVALCFGFYYPECFPDVFIRNVDTTTAKGLHGKFSKVYVKDRLSEVTVNLVQHGQMDLVINLEEKLPEIASYKGRLRFVVALGDSANYPFSVNSVVNTLMRKEWQEIAIEILVHPNDFIRKPAPRWLQALNESTLRNVRCLMNYIEFGESCLSFDLAEKHLRFFEKTDVLFQVGTTIRNEWNFQFVVNFFPTDEINNKHLRKIVWREHGIFELYQADHCIFSNDELIRFLELFR